MLKALLLPLALALPVLSCGASEDAATTPEAGAEATTPKAQTVALESASRELRCGCKIDSIGHCGNYVAEGDEWLEISNPEDHGLSSMAWCSVPAEEHVHGTVSGERTGDKIKVATLEVTGKSSK